MGLSHKVKRRRKQLGYTLQTLADITGLCIATLSRVERGIKNPDEITVRQLSRWLESADPSKKMGKWRIVFDQD